MPPRLLPPKEHAQTIRQETLLQSPKPPPPVREENAHDELFLSNDLVAQGTERLFQFYRRVRLQRGTHKGFVETENLQSLLVYTCAIFDIYLSCASWQFPGAQARRWY